MATYQEILSRLFEVRGPVEFENALFKEDMEFSIRTLTLKQENGLLRIPKKLIFKSCHFRSVKFEGCIFEDNLEFHNCTFDHGLGSYNCTFNEGLITSFISAPNIEFLNVTVNKVFQLLDFTCSNELKITFEKIIGIAMIVQTKFNGHTRSKHVLVTYRASSEASISISFIHTEVFSVLGHDGTSRFIIYDIQATKVLIDGVCDASKHRAFIKKIIASEIVFTQISNHGLMTIHDIKGIPASESSIKMIACYLGNCELYDIDFSSFSKIEFENCHLTSVIPVNVVWNFKRKAYESTSEASLKEVFRQLKNVASKNIDKVSQLKFEKLEMASYEKQLHPKQDFGDWFIFMTNKYSNDHGQNWILPIAWLFGISLVVYTIVNYYAGGFSNYHIGNYFNFVMPFHSLKEVLHSDNISALRGSVYFWDVAERIISSYFIFQFLRAFRKYVN